MTERIKSNVDFTNTEIAFSNKSDTDLKRTEWLFRMMNNPSLVKVGSFLGVWATKLNLPFSKRIIERTLFFQFCGGKSLSESQAVVDKLQHYKTLTILDYGAEGKSDEDDLDFTMEKLLQAVKFAASNASVPVVSVKLTAIASNFLLEKWQSDGGLDPIEKKAFDRVVMRLDKLCSTAHDLGVGVFVDAEESWMQNTIDYLVYLMMEKYNGERCVVYNTYQLYRADKLADLKAAHDVALQAKYILGAKLVRGAYMLKESKRADELGYESPIQKTKKATDDDYNAALRYCVEHYETIGSCNASHNVESNLLLAELIADKGLPKDHPHLNFCQLYGMSDYITFNLADAGYNVAKYLVYGPIKEVVPYLVRRAEENTSVTGDMSRELQLIHTEVKRRGL